MAASPSDLGRRYTPLLLIALVEILLVALAPSGSNTVSQLAGPGVTQGSAVGSGTTGTGGESLGSGTTGSGLTGGTGGSGGSAGAAGTGVAGGSSGSGATAGTTGAGGKLNQFGYASTDMSKCSKAGLQVMPTVYAPPCKPVWHGGDNGGATMTGVTAKTINFVYYRAQGNAQVNALLAQKNLAATDDQFCTQMQAFTAYVNKRFELYGRKFVSLDGPGNHSGKALGSNCHYPYFQGQCSLTPPDAPCEKAEADLIAQQLKPAFVIVPTADPSFSYELAHDHILVSGGFNAPESYHDQLAPYFYEVSMNGTELADLNAEYYCKKMAGKPVQFAGLDVMGAPGTKAPVRKLGIVFPENNGDVTTKLSVDRLAQAVEKCGGGKVVEFSYASDINSAQQQANTTIAALKKAGVTTMACWCDPIAPVFLSNAADSNQYHPEVFIIGAALIDYDALAQLYNPNVWRYAFGVSLLGQTIPFSDTNAVLAWHDVGMSGEPDKTANLSWTFIQIMANMFQNAGPRPTPDSIHTGSVNAPPMGGDPVNFRVAYKAPYQWSSQADVREVWYCPTQNSSLNNSPGTYVPVNAGRRYQTGQWNDQTQVFPSGPCPG